MKILFLHGWHSVPGGVKPTFLKDHGDRSSTQPLIAMTSMPLWRPPLNRLDYVWTVPSDCHISPYSLSSAAVQSATS